MSQADAVRQGFRHQAAVCATAGAPFTGRLCGLIAERMTAAGIGDRVLNWPGNPEHDVDALPLRLMGGLHDLARSGRRERLSALYAALGEGFGDDAAWSVLDGALAEEAEWLSPWLDGPPQTNEVARSAGLMGGLLILSRTYGLPFALYELGASAGLNTVLDRYAFDLGGVAAGDASSPLTIAPEWRGAPPPSAEVRVVRRGAVDRAPMDPADPLTRRRLSAYVWADQAARLERLDKALTIAAAQDTRVETGDAADWLERQLDPAPEPGVCRVVVHTIAYQYFSPDSQARVRGRIEAAGARALPDAPVAWLRLEAEGGAFQRRPVLRLTAWPGLEDRVLAVVHPHGEWFDWRG
ncbi:MAG: DUF2332 family protein [Brevundimonas sp.]|nr:MAG: DUF2332 family protein [Brevundimonas sp.]